MEGDRSGHKKGRLADSTGREPWGRRGMTRREREREKMQGRYERTTSDAMGF